MKFMYMRLNNKFLLIMLTSALIACGGASENKSNTASTIGTMPASGALPSTVVDVTPPSAPEGLRTDGRGSTSITLSWRASIDSNGVTGYQVFRNGTLISTIPLLNFTDNGLTAGSSYAYSIKALDAAGNSSAASTEFLVSTIALDVDAAPASSTPVSLNPSPTPMASTSAGGTTPGGFSDRLGGTMELVK